MELTPEERQALSDKMRALGKSRSAKKRRAVQNNVKAAHEARWGRNYGYRKPK